MNDLGAVDGVLAGHAVDDQVDLLRHALAVDPLELVHQLLVDVQPAGGVEDHGVGAELLGFADGGLADGDGILLRAIGVDGDVELLAEHVQLVDGGGALQVGGDQQRLAAALP